jgi:hypothetical protein
VLETIPGSDELFSLRRYKEEIGKPYSKICFYLCTLTDYLKDTINSSSSDEDISELMKETNTHELIQPNHSCEDEEVASPTPAATIQCPLCLYSYPVKDIEAHASNCSMWLLNENDEENPDTTVGHNEADKVESTFSIDNMPKQAVKQILIEEITKVVEKHLEKDRRKRVTVRRKVIWDDFKSELQNNNITPTTRIKVVFAGEPAVDDGSPRCELFSGVTDSTQILKHNMHSFTFYTLLVPKKSYLV